MMRDPYFAVLNLVAVNLANNMRALIITLSLACLLAACGHKTPLALPKPAAPAAAQTPAPAQTPSSSEAK